MARSAVDLLLKQMNEAFEGKGKDWHSLRGNLRSVPLEAWRWVPPGGVRSIRDLVQHVGGCKYMCENHTFGDATFAWEDALVGGEGVLTDADAAVAWLRDGHERLRRRLESLDDAELARPRKTYWGIEPETWWTIGVMIQHDLYHSGEINHIRALFQGDDC